MFIGAPSVAIKWSMKETIRVLLVEDNPGDALLLRESIADLQHAETAVEWTESARLADALRCFPRNIDSMSCSSIYRCPIARAWELSSRCIIRFRTRRW